MKKILIFSIIGLVVLSIFGYLKFGPSRVFAAGAGEVDGVDLHIKVEGSADHGATWFNFSASEPGEADNQTITVSPGEQIEFRVKVWNTGVLFRAANVDIAGSVTNAGYVSALDLTASDFIGFLSLNGGAGTAVLVQAGSTEDANFQEVQGTIQLAATFPVGQTLLVGNVNIVDYDPQALGFNPSRFIAQTLGFKRAFALGVDRASALRIAVNVAAPGGGGSSSGTKVTPTPTPSIAANDQLVTLPETGGSMIEDINKFFKF